MKDSLVVTTLALALIGVSSSQAAIPVDWPLYFHTLFIT